MPKPYFKTREGAIAAFRAAIKEHHRLLAEVTKKRRWVNTAKQENRVYAFDTYIREKLLPIMEALIDYDWRHRNDGEQEEHMGQNVAVDTGVVGEALDWYKTQQEYVPEAGTLDLLRERFFSYRELKLHTTALHQYVLEQLPGWTGALFTSQESFEKHLWNFYETGGLAGGTASPKGAGVSKAEFLQTLLRNKHALVQSIKTDRDNTIPFFRVWNDGMPELSVGHSGVAVKLHEELGFDTSIGITRVEGIIADFYLNGFEGIPSPRLKGYNEEAFHEISLSFIPELQQEMEDEEVEDQLEEFQRAFASLWKDEIENEKLLQPKALEQALATGEKKEVLEEVDWIACTELSIN